MLEDTNDLLCAYAYDNSDGLIKTFLYSAIPYLSS